MDKQELNIAFLGLGVMGFPMAAHLLKSSHKVCVYNRTAARSQAWLESCQAQVQTEPRRALTIAEACQEADFIFSCVGNDTDLEQVMLSDDGVLASAKPDAIICDHTTSSAKLARRLYGEAKKRSLGFLDAPVSGGQAGAEKAMLSIMVGGDQSDYERIKPLLAYYGLTIERIGESGSGQLAKMVNQICITGVLEALSEALHFGEAVGLDLEKVLSVISGGAAQSWQMDNRARTMLERSFDFGFAVDWMRKDLAFVLDEAKGKDMQLPLVALVDSYYEEVQAMGGGRWDTSSLFARYNKDESVQ